MQGRAGAGASSSIWWLVHEREGVGFGARSWFGPILPQRKEHGLFFPLDIQPCSSMEGERRAMLPHRGSPKLGWVLELGSSVWGPAQQGSMCLGLCTQVVSGCRWACTPLSHKQLPVWPFLSSGVLLLYPSLLSLVTFIPKGPSFFGGDPEGAMHPSKALGRLQWRLVHVSRRADHLQAGRGRASPFLMQVRL